MIKSWHESDKKRYLGMQVIVRSANRGNGYNAWNVNPAGNVNNNNAANNSLTLAPDCTGQR